MKNIILIILVIGTFLATSCTEMLEPDVTIYLSQNEAVIIDTNAGSGNATVYFLEGEITNQVETVQNASIVTNIDDNAKLWEKR